MGVRAADTRQRHSGASEDFCPACRARLFTRPTSVDSGRPVRTSGLRLENVFHLGIITVIGTGDNVRTCRAQTEVSWASVLRRFGVSRSFSSALTGRCVSGRASCGSVLEGKAFGGNMLLEVGVIAAGVPVGWLLRRQRAVARLTDTVMTWSIRALLFFLGMDLGGNALLMSQLDSLGVKAVIIALCVVVGSLVGARLLEPYLHLPKAPEAPAATTGTKRP